MKFIRISDQIIGQANFFSDALPLSEFQLTVSYEKNQNYIYFLIKECWFTQKSFVARSNCICHSESNFFHMTKSLMCMLKAQQPYISHETSSRMEASKRGIMGVQES